MHAKLVVGGACRDAIKFLPVCHQTTNKMVFCWRRPVESQEGPGPLLGSRKKEGTETADALAAAALSEYDDRKASKCFPYLRHNSLSSTFKHQGYKVLRMYVVLVITIAYSSGNRGDI